MVQRNVYLSIGIIGSVFILLSILTGQNNETIYTLAYLTGGTLIFIRLVEEWRYFRRYNAAPASGFFLGALAVLAVSGSYVSRFVQLGDFEFLQSPLVEIQLNLLSENFFVFLNQFGLIFALVFYVTLLWFFHRYHAGRYPIIFIFRKRFPSMIVTAFHLGLLGLLVWFWVSTRVVEVIEVSFVSLSIIMILQHHVLKIIWVPMRRVPVHRVSNRNGSQTATRSSPSRLTAPSASPTGGSRSSNAYPYVSSYQPPASKPGRLGIRTTSGSTSTVASRASQGPSPAQRRWQQRRQQTENHLRGRDNNQVSLSPAVSAPARQSQPQPALRDSDLGQSRNTNSVVSNVEVVLGIESTAQSHFKPKRGFKASDIDKLRPLGTNITEDDFKCIFCYEFPTEAGKNTVICPHCHHASHEDEYRKWASTSPFCSYCNKSLENISLIRIPGKKYEKIIHQFLKS